MATMQSRSVRRREDVRLLTGRGNYSADQHPPRMLHAVLVRSHHAHEEHTRRTRGEPEPVIAGNGNGNGDSAH